MPTYLCFNGLTLPKSYGSLHANIFLFQWFCFTLKLWISCYHHCDHNKNLLSMAIKGVRKYTKQLKILNIFHIQLFEILRFQNLPDFGQYLPRT